MPKKKTIIKKTELKKVILVVEDEEPLALAIRKKLELNNFSVVTARTVKQALNYIKDVENIVAVWLDHYLLGKDDGLVFVAKMKSDKSKWKKIPIFVVSNTSSISKMQAYMNLGVNKYYVKSDCPLCNIIQDIKKHVRG